MGASSEKWFCMRCQAIRGNKIKWGEIEGEEAIASCIKKIYLEVITWNKNIFMLPRGKAGTDFIKELTRLLYLFVNDTKWARLGLPLVHIFIPLMLQKPSSNSRARDNANYLSQRLLMWSDGKIDSLLIEGREIQRRLSQRLAQLKKKKESKNRAYCRLMLRGRV